MLFLYVTIVALKIRNAIYSGAFGSSFCSWKNRVFNLIFFYYRMFLLSEDIIGQFQLRNQIVLLLFVLALLVLICIIAFSELIGKLFYSDDPFELADYPMAVILFFLVIQIGIVVVNIGSRVKKYVDRKMR